MKTIQSTETVTIKVSNNELFEDKWLNYQLLSKKVNDIEKERNIGYKSLRTKLYNSMSGNKYNISEIAGLKCIDIDNPMRSTASLKIVFERV